MERLRRTLRRIDGRGYGAYRDIEGEFDFQWFKLVVRHVQSDPFAPPGRFEVHIPIERLKLPEWAVRGQTERIAASDFMLRLVAKKAERFSRKRGSGNSGLYAFARPGQKILRRSGLEIGRDAVILRFGVGLPADGRRIRAGTAITMLTKEVPEIVETLLPGNRDDGAMSGHVMTAVDADFVRGKLRGNGLVAFIADGSMLPRESGVDDRPMEGGRPFRSPDELRVEFQLPSGRTVSGMGIPEGVTLIAGGGFHGKSTLLEAIQFGVYNHIPGDGRELAVSLRDGVKIRAEDGRYIHNVDISGFITRLPSGIDTRHFSNADASGSTSQAANIVEAIEMGTHLLLIDEDTSATNFMIRDELMRELIRKEPIVPFIDRARELHRRYGISSIIVVGGAGDYLSIADTVILMEEYEPICATERAHRIASKRPYRPAPEFEFPGVSARQLIPDSVSPYRGRKIKVDARSKHHITFGRQDIDLSAVEQIAEREQARAIAKIMLHGMQSYPDLPLKEMCEAVFAEIERSGFAVLGRIDGFLAMPRKFEVAAALNRLRGMKFRQVGGAG